MPEVVACMGRAVRAQSRKVRLRCMGWSLNGKLEEGEAAPRMG